MEILLLPGIQFLLVMILVLAVSTFIIFVFGFGSTNSTVGFDMAMISILAIAFVCLTMLFPIDIAVSLQILLASGLMCLSVIAIKLKLRVDRDSLFAIFGADTLLLKATIAGFWPIVLVVAGLVGVQPFSSMFAIGIMFWAIGFVIASVVLLFANSKWFGLSHFGAVIVVSITLAIGTGFGLTLMIYQSYGFAISLLGLVTLVLIIVASINVVRICESKMYVTLSWVLNLGEEGRTSQLFLCLIAFLLTLFTTLLGSHALILRLGAG